MRTVGKIIKDLRVSKGYSLEELENRTKIKKIFLSAIEKENWNALPEFPVLAGFVRSIAHTLDTDANQLVAFLRRDSPPRTVNINPKPDIGNKFRIRTRLMFILVTAPVVLAVVGYLAYQYFLFISPPTLSLELPPEGFVATEGVVDVKGMTSQDATIKVNNQPVVVDPDGNFSVEIEISETTREIEIKATSRYGKETVVRRTIETKFDQ